MKKNIQKIRFLVDVPPFDFSGISYAEGQEIEASDASAEFWIKRGKAAYIEDFTTLSQRSQDIQTERKDGKEEDAENVVPARRKSLRHEAWDRGDDA